MDLLILDLAQKAPVILSILSVIGLLRLIMKPVMSILKAVAAETKTDKDDLIVEKIESSAVWKGLCWVIDYVASVKLPK